ncbi:ATP-binding protein [Ureaplasma sp. ES3154-GEN]|uniref:DEAD/DEAH box helicase n=1 Tax=Ureaplasma sp. ES3154-GEN TaxID=2984844 RepID=UPI0021E7B048|nr:ATP-binding protein [Ureaplasma sp. ES3154-GEN]MCV3743573.1 ATP-binding protein [Ureaplasma sp. ES3154-GEN]
MINNQALQNKLLNLLSTDSRDQCIRTKIDKSHADLLTFFKLDDIKSFINNDISELEYKVFIDTKTLKKDLAATFHFTEFNEVLKKYQILLSDVATKAKINALEEDFDVNQSEMIEYILKKVDGLIAKLDLINQQSQGIYKQTGIWPLYIGYDYIIGNTIKPNAINAPIHLLPVQIVKRANKLFLERRKTNNTLNQKLLLFLKRDYNNSFVKFDDEANMLDDVKKLTNQNYISSYNSQNRFLNLSTSEIKDKFQQYFLYNAYIIGVFQPRGNAIKNDLEELIKQNVDVFVENYDDNQDVISDDYHLKRAQDPKPLVQLKKPLNLYQSYAIYSSLVKNTLIYGPPGTGKSQVISNILANIVFQNNNVLVVSEKKAALDVLIDRLFRLNQLTLYLDSDENKMWFYKKISDLLSTFGRFWLFNQKNDKKDLVSQIYTSNNAKKIIQSNVLMQNLNRLKVSLYNADFINFKKQMFNIMPEKWIQIKDYHLYELLQKILGNDLNSISARLNDYLAINTFIKKYKIDFNETLLNSLLTLQAKIKTEQKLYPDWWAKVNDGSYKNDYLFGKQILDQLDLTSIFSDLYDETFEEKINKVNVFFTLWNDTSVGELQTIWFNLKKYLKPLNDCLKLQKNQINRLKVIDWFIAKNEVINKNWLFYRFQNDQNLIEKYYKTIDLLTNDVVYERFDFNTLRRIYDLQQSGFNNYHGWLHKNYDVLNLNYLQELLTLNLQIDVDFFNLLVGFDFDVDQLVKIYQLQAFYHESLSDYTSLSTINTNDWFAQYKQQNNAFCQTLDKEIYEEYWSYLDQWIKHSDSKTKEQLKNMLSIAKLPRQPEVATFVKEYYKYLIKLFPIWIAKPNDVCDIFPLQQDLFDYGIFDEASQMFLENAYPVLYRTKIKIVAGDDKQLKPTNFFSTRNDDNNEYAIDDVDVAESLLDRSKSALWTTYWLKNHYRSQSADLISFSSHYLYDDELVFASYNHQLYKGIETYNVDDGIYENNTNTQEAQKIINLLIEHEANYKQILVITFNLKQAELIENMIATQYFDTDVYQKVLDDEIQITNLENVQGNEADLVILGITYAKDNNGVLRNQFGPIIKTNGMNRLNVAITRARQKMFVVKSFMGTELNINKNNENYMVFYHFINFCDQLNLNNNDVITRYQVNENNFNNQVDREIYQLLKTLINDQQIILYQYDLLGYQISFGIYNKLNQQFDLLIDYQMTNDILYDSNWQTLYDKYQFLIDRHYPLLAFTDLEIINDYAQVARKIKQTFNELIIS